MNQEGKGCALGKICPIKQSSEMWLKRKSKDTQEKIETKKKMLAIPKTWSRSTRDDNFSR